MWRPKDWEETSNLAITRLSMEGIDFNPACFSAGADAMLEALRKGGVYITPSIPYIPYCALMKVGGFPNKAGHLVFIPDEEKL